MALVQRPNITNEHFPVSGQVRLGIQEGMAVPKGEELLGIDVPGSGQHNVHVKVEERIEERELMNSASRS